MIIRRIALAALILLASATAIGQTRVYQWTDADGVVHFSSEAPPAGTEGVVERSINGTPLTGSVPPTPPPEPTPGEMAAAELAAEEAQQARIDADYRRRMCEHGRQLVRQIEPVLRVLVTREDGSQEMLTGEARLAELERARAIVAENCD